MVSTRTDRFECAHRNEQQLNQRQRQVLDLLVAGRTNGEIGEALGITLDGAKWNVSEILGKLGLESREEAAEYWRLRIRRTSPIPALRGLFGLGAQKWVAGTAAVALVGLTLMGLLSKSDDTKPGELPPFYLEARFESEDSSRTIGTSIAAQASPGASVHREGVVRWWQQDADNARIEIEAIEPAEDDSLSVIVVDGENQTYYRSTTNTYTRAPLFDFPDDLKIRRRPWNMSTFLGPWAIEVSSLEEMLEQLRGDGDGGLDARISGSETVLGRRTTIIELSPVSSGHSTSWSAGDGRTPVSQSSESGTSRIWVDEERFVIMKHVVEDDVQSYSFEITRLDWETKVPASKLKFDPPAGAELIDSDGAGSAVLGGDQAETRSTMDGGTSGQMGFVTPPGMLRFTSAPGGLLAKGVESSEGHGIVEMQRVQYVAEGSQLVLEQTRRPGGIAGRPPPESPEVTVRGTAGFAGSTDGELALTWYENGHVIRLTATGFTEPELIAIAESLERAP